MGMRPRKSSKNPPILSHEFLIQNHADIVSCVAMVFIIGLMFQATSPVATLFVTMQHNVTLGGPADVEGEEANIHPSEIVYRYTNGLRDIFAIFFYCLLAIVLHAILQEYLLDKVNKRLHLSKTKHSKFNESGQLLAFYLASTIWAGDIMIREGFISSVSSFWDNYPETHAAMPFTVKFFFIAQIAYWIHTFPEFYFQKIKKDEMRVRMRYGILYLIFITFAYLLNFTRVSLCLLLVHYFAESVYHSSRMLYFADKSIYNIAFKAWNILFVLIRLTSFTISVLTFWHGLAKTGVASLDLSEGNYNTFLVRITCLVALCLLQAWMMWRFITFHLKRNREQVQIYSSAPQSPPVTSTLPSKKEKKQKETSPPGTPNNQENGITKRSIKGKKAH